MESVEPSGNLTLGAERRPYSGRDGGGGGEGVVRKAGAAGEAGRRWAAARAEKKTEGR